MKLSFLGACRQVTGSMYLLELEGDYKILVDCGLDTGNKLKDMVPDQYGNIFPFDPSDIDLVILTHAHMDHTGLLPNLVRYGYDGQILSTAPTYALTRLLLLDSAALNERRMEAAKKENRFSFSDNQREKNFYHEHYYLERHVEDTTDRFVTVAFNQPFRILDGVSVTFVTAGHLLGAAHVYISVKEGGETKRILFSGDIGRKGYPMLEDPIAPPKADYVICETTYANRNLQETSDYEGRLLEMIVDTCVKKSGRLIIPCFAVGKSQMMLYLMNNLYMKRLLPAVRVFLDSPLATGATRVSKKQVKYMNKEARERFEDYEEIFDFDTLSYVIES
ncbi:MAG: MBL fold metallo-hydrolase, partial [Cytophagales bacterium]|nr:MBL fold metallo-hydrolase [Cytophagales bacterium]